MTYATVADVSTRLGRPVTSSTEISQVTAWLGDVEALILARISGFAAAVTAGAPAAAVVVMVEANAVIRKIRNPDGKVSENIDDYQYRLNPDAARGDLFLTDEEWAWLTPDSPSAAFTVTPYGPTGFRTDDPVDVDWS